jgi:hypothetical protein
VYYANRLRKKVKKNWGWVSEKFLERNERGRRTGIVIRKDYG